MAVFGGILGAGYAEHRTRKRAEEERLRERKDVYRIVEMECVSIAARMARDVSIANKKSAIMNRRFVEQNLAQGVSYPKITVPIELMTRVAPFLATRASVINVNAQELEGLLERLYLSLLKSGYEEMNDEQWNKFGEVYNGASQSHRDIIMEAIDDITTTRRDEFGESVRADPKNGDDGESSLSSQQYGDSGAS